jgi:aminopeptidase
MDANWNKAYAKLLVGACLGITEGSRLRIAAEFAHRDLVRAVAEEAYAAGARALRVDWDDPRLGRIRADRSQDKWLDDEPLPLARLASAYVDELWSTLSFVGEEEAGVMEGADAERVSRASRARSRAWKPFREVSMANRVAWCVAPVPTAGWARSILPPERLGDDPEAALAEVLRPILRLDAAEPSAAWLAHLESVEKRSRRLRALGLRELRFAGPGTDLVVGLSPRSAWVGGGSTTPEGRRFSPNIPTEEVFATPDARATSGRAACTRPVEVLGAKVEGAWFEFKGGVAVKAGASRNAESLEKYLDTDPGSRRLGEVALVDSQGPIARSGLVFDSALIDENAACHIALGSGYEEAFTGAESMDSAAKAACGFNESLVHLDFMIGGDEVDATGVDAEGRETPIIRAGRFVI